MNILEEAQEAVKARQDSYDSPKTNFRRTAILWEAYFGAKYEGVSEGKFRFRIDEFDVANLNILQKISRLIATPNHHDSWVDIAGYAQCGNEVTEDGRDN